MAKSGGAGQFAALAQFETRFLAPRYKAACLEEGKGKQLGNRQSPTAFSQLRNKKGKLTAKEQSPWIP